MDNIATMWHSKAHHAGFNTIQSKDKFTLTCKLYIECSHGEGCEYLSAHQSYISQKHTCCDLSLIACIISSV